ncbi:MAG TPA: hypothetical protein VEW08_15675 [Steroidobacteraceae bacterium]|nr:hypothetical protein [Steroidobacteraceae bacterium]
MYGNLRIGGRKLAIWMTAATLTLGAALAGAQEAAPDPALGGWLGKEYTVEYSTLNEHMPTGGKLTFVFDAEDNVVRICTRNSSRQRNPWRMDFAAPCGVTLVFTRGTRYCTLDDVKTGNAEVLSACHRLRSRDIAMRPSKVKGAVELNDMIAFLIQENGKPTMSILVDSPARVTDDGIIQLK